MKDSHRRPTSLVRRLSAYAAIALLAFSAACAAPTPDKEEKTVGDVRNLNSRVRQFHKNMRWEKFEKASNFVGEAHRQAFLGRYEELGDNYDIVSLEIKQVHVDDHSNARVEVEQKWYGENMVVNEERFVEEWTRGDDGWRVGKRMEKKDRER